VRHQTMDKVQKYNSFNTNTPSSESYRKYGVRIYTAIKLLRNGSSWSLLWAL